MHRTRQMKALYGMLDACFDACDGTKPTMLYLPQQSMASKAPDPVVYITGIADVSPRGTEDLGISKFRWFPTQLVSVDIYGLKAPAYKEHIEAWIRSRQYRQYQARNNMSAKIDSAVIEPDHLRTSESQRCIMTFRVTVQAVADFAINNIEEVDFELSEE